MFIDEAEIIVMGGHGGAGKVSFAPGKKSGPDGGNGGKGGDLIAVATTDLTALRPYTHVKTLSAENGQPGGNNNKEGHAGNDKRIPLPLGSVLIDIETQEQIEITQPGQEIVLAKGGLGGRGNFEFRSSRNTTPMYAQPGLPGQKRQFKVHLKLIADFGLMGLPNAGKSSLLNELTKANVKTANYPFTTLEPNLGVLPNGKILADIPGLIEGAHEGKGLGIKFLKHIEKTSTLLHCISAESDDLNRDYQVIREELEQYNPALLEKEEILLLTKVDLVDKSQLEKSLKVAKKLNPKVIPISIHDWDSLITLKQELQ